MNNRFMHKLSLLARAFDVGELLLKRTEEDDCPVMAIAEIGRVIH